MLQPQLHNPSVKEDVMTTVTLPTTRFTELLLATDFSDESRRALMAAKAIAQRFHAEITAINVTPPVSPEGMKAKGSCVVGSVDLEILRAAQEAGADLVVTGPHGRLGSSRWLYGS